MNIIKIVGIILGSILILVLIAYGIYRARHKTGESGFQDYIIDSVKGGTKKEDAERAKESLIPRADPITAVETKEANTGVPNPDPLKSFVPPTETTQKTEEISIKDAPTPAWLTQDSDTSNAHTTANPDPLANTPFVENTAPMPAWMNTNNTPTGIANENVSHSENTENIPSNSAPTLENTAPMPV